MADGAWTWGDSVLPHLNYPSPTHSVCKDMLVVCVSYPEHV